jgi:integrase
VFRFESPSGKPIGLSALSVRVIMLARKAGVKLSMHSLRKGFGCRYAGKVSAHVLQRLMRHADISTTMGYYANIDAAVEEAVLGPQRNTSRNSKAKPEAGRNATADATASGERTTGAGNS